MQFFEMSGALLLRLFGWIVLLAFSLTSGSAAAPSPSWQGEWEKAVDAAKKEGQIAVYTKAGYDGVFSAFQKKYPEIKVISVAGQAADITNRLIAERRAEKYIADVFSFGVRSTQSLMQIKGLDPIRPLLLLPEVVDESKWYEGHVYTDSEKTYILRYLSVAEQQLGLNTNLIKEQKKEFKSYWDKMEGQNRRSRCANRGTGQRQHAFLVSQPATGSSFSQKSFRRDGSNDDAVFAPGDRLARPGQIRHLFFLQRRRRNRQTPGLADRFA
jgi:hypothetical protein